MGQRLLGTANRLNRRAERCRADPLCAGGGAVDCTGIIEVRGRGGVATRLLPKQETVGSNPIARSGQVS